MTPEEIITNAAISYSQGYPVNFGDVAREVLASPGRGESCSAVTRRDYFAAKAMHQMLAGAILPPGYDATKEMECVAERAYEMADAMLKVGGITE